MLVKMVTGGGEGGISASECQWIAGQTSGTVTLTDSEYVVVLGQGGTAGTFSNSALLEKGGASQTITNYTGNSLTASLSADGKTVTFSQGSGYNFILVILK